MSKKDRSENSPNLGLSLAIAFMTFVILFVFLVFLFPYDLFSWLDYSIKRTFLPFVDALGLVFIIFSFLAVLELRQSL